MKKQKFQLSYRHLKYDDVYERLPVGELAFVLDKGHYIHRVTQDTYRIISNDGECAGCEFRNEDGTCAKLYNSDGSNLVVEDDFGCKLFVRPEGGKMYHFAP